MVRNHTMALFAFRDPQSLDSFVPVLCRGSMLRGNTITRTGSPKIFLSRFTMTSAVLFINRVHVFVYFLLTMSTLRFTYLVSVNLKILSHGQHPQHLHKGKTASHELNHWLCDTDKAKLLAACSNLCKP